LKLLKKEHQKETWNNCGTDMLCIMLYLEGEELAETLNIVLGMDECTLLLLTISNKIIFPV